MKYYFVLVWFLFIVTGCGKTLNLKAIKVAKGVVETTVTTTSSGTVEAEQQAILAFATTGKVKSIDVKLGDLVKKDQILAELDNSELKTGYQTAKREFERSQELFAAKLISKSGFDETRKMADIAGANFERSILRAPFDGMVAELNLQLGELANVTGQSKAPLRLVDLKPRQIHGEIDEFDLSKVKVGQSARVKISSVSSEPFQATVTKVIPYISTSREQDRTAQVELALPADAGNVPVGASADIEIVVDRHEDVLTIPSRTLLGVKDQRYVYRSVEGVLEKTKVEVGSGNYDRSEVLSGLKEGDIVVYPPVDAELKDGEKVKVELSQWP